MRYVCWGLSVVIVYVSCVQAAEVEVARLSRAPSAKRVKALVLPLPSCPGASPSKAKSAWDQDQKLKQAACCLPALLGTSRGRSSLAGAAGAHIPLENSFLRIANKEECQKLASLAEQGNYRAVKYLLNASEFSEEYLFKVYEGVLQCEGKAHACNDRATRACYTQIVEDLSSEMGMYLVKKQKKSDAEVQQGLLWQHAEPCDDESEEQLKVQANLRHAISKRDPKKVKEYAQKASARVLLTALALAERKLYSVLDDLGRNSTYVFSQTLFQIDYTLPQDVAGNDVNIGDEEWSPKGKTGPKSSKRELTEQEQQLCRSEEILQILAGTYDQRRL